MLLLTTKPPIACGSNAEFADMRAAYDTLDAATQREVHDLICLRRQI